MLETVLAHLRTSVPFAALVGIEIVDLASGRAMARLPERKECSNHIGSVHAGALFTLAEAASGAAMAGALAPVLLRVRPVTANAQIAYKKIARGPLVAVAEVGLPAENLLEKLDQDGRCQFPVTVSIRDERGDEVASVAVEWHVKNAVSG